MRNNIKIGNFEISENKTFLIAEACDNHFGSLSNAKKMITLAKESGADCIKFQHHLADEEMLPDVPMSSNFDQPLYEFLKENSLTLENHIELKNYCEKVGIIYLCTPFSLKAAQELNSIGCVDFKIGSGEMTDIPTLIEISKFANTLILSTGMSTFDEIDRTYLELKKTGVNFCFLHCVSEYPTFYEDLNLKVIPKLIEKYNDLLIGHSDHTDDIYSSIVAVALGARIIEKHVTLDKNLKGPDDDVSIDFNKFKEMSMQIRNIEKSLGSTKKVHEKEKEIRKWALRSLVTIKDIDKNQIITQDMIWSKRPGTGVPSFEMKNFIGKKTNKKIKKNTLIKWEDIE